MNYISIVAAAGGWPNTGNNRFPRQLISSSRIPILKQLEKSAGDQCQLLCAFPGWPSLTCVLLRKNHVLQEKHDSLLSRFDIKSKKPFIQGWPFKQIWMLFLLRRALVFHQSFVKLRSPILKGKLVTCPDGQPYEALTNVSAHLDWASNHGAPL